MEEATGLACPFCHPNKRTLVHVLVLHPTVSCRPGPPQRERDQEHAPTLCVVPCTLVHSAGWGHQRVTGRTASGPVRTGLKHSETSTNSYQPEDGPADSEGE